MSQMKQTPPPGVSDPGPGNTGSGIAVSTAAATTPMLQLASPQGMMAPAPGVGLTPGLVTVPGVIPTAVIPGGAGAVMAQQMVPVKDAPVFHRKSDPATATAVPTPPGAGGDGQVSMANTKEKTPMCLINELARYNKILHQYTLTDEQGPAHKKTFFVKLKLGDEEYAANGASIKKAQHAAADIALEKTQYKHPPPKPSKYVDGTGVCDPSSSGTITPTVELNALAMKRGEPAVYRPIEPPRPACYGPPNLDFRGMYNQRYHYPKAQKVFYVSLKVGNREFMGEGNTRQAARHLAASKALKTLAALPMPNQEKAPLQVSDGVGDGAANGATDDQLKSEISLVHEIALKRNLAVNFEITRESGPPHMKLFITKCTCGEFETEGEGNSKKISKKRAAEMMLERLQKLPPVTQQVVKPKIKRPMAKKKNRNLVKVVPEVQKASLDYGVGINPISRLIQIQQAKKEKEPVYTLVAEKGMPRKREFIMQVTVGDKQCKGTGPNKKLAKRNAAESMLQELGYSRPAPQPTKSSIKTANGEGGIDKKVHFVDSAEGASNGAEPVDAKPVSGRSVKVPGVLVRSDQGYASSGVTPPSQPGVVPESRFTPQTIAAIAQELLDKGSSKTAEAILRTGQRPLSSRPTVQPKDQLCYLAEVLCFEVRFTDFPKGPHKTEYLSLVTVSLNPPQVSQGAGATIQASHNAAALTALKAMAEMGGDKAVDGASAKADALAGGDGPHVKKEPSLGDQKLPGLLPASAIKQDKQ
ncbi:double-stranded RNA-binding protein Staufen homolog 2 [Lingula anatina]|uniref:Double-stranded RNA-binding protein Staufen homolog 2 n=1 Tax=Lingula anatina TaxID=7574 RepID=A0A2R2MSY3_LINAN|nr:double-stranded RNA-binding protein Staufen homolog 2 [Lingula anatina]|eukprot:XP_023933375.1 double-stranded RNA-binding protein Staufen homolog 2 [Lingula anatina]